MFYLTCGRILSHNVVNTLQWRHNGHDSVSNRQPYDCLLNRLFRRRSKKTSKLRVTGLCTGNSPGTGEFPTLVASNAENVSIWWRHHDLSMLWLKTTSHYLHQYWLIVSYNELLHAADGDVTGNAKDIRDRWLKSLIQNMLLLAYPWQTWSQYFQDGPPR